MDYCIHLKSWPNTFFGPKETWCELGINKKCENCIYYRSKEDYEDDLADYKYEKYKDSLDY